MFTVNESIPVSNKSKSVSDKSISKNCLYLCLTNLYLTNIRRIQDNHKCINENPIIMIFIEF